jgi:hypothetical protein
LNKFATEDDPNLVKIVHVLSDMVQSSFSKTLPKGQLAPQRQPWQLASDQVDRIDNSFEALIKINQTRKSENGDTELLILQKYRFESWAYAVGLITILGTRQPLHEHLDGFECKELCGLLHQMLQVLEAWQPVAASIRKKKLRELFDKLLRMFPETDRGVMRQAFISRVLDESEQFDAPEGFSDHDLDAIAAMKRIKILSEESEATRSVDARLAIQAGEIQFDSKRLSARSTGILRRDQQHEVIVEWKKYEGFWDTDIGNQLFHRTELLTEFLQTSYRSSAILDLRILECLGYYHDESKRRIGFVYAIPKSVGRQSHLRLNQLLRDYNERQLNPPPVGDRMRLAEMLCKAMFDLHVAEWFHKNLSSYNILLFPEDEAEEDISNYSVICPYIVGFNNSRPSKPSEFSDPASISLDLRRYWHPDYKNVVGQKYRHEFDYYSLGVVLLEIGLWSPLSMLTTEFAQVGPSEFAEGIRSLCSGLSSFIGVIYQGVVVDLLEAFDGGGDRNEFAPLGDRIQFQARILQELGKCVA